MASSDTDRGSGPLALLPAERFDPVFNSVHELLRTAVAERSDTPISFIGEDGQRKHTTVGEAHDRSLRIASRLRELDDGRPLLVVANSITELAVGVWACIEACRSFGFWSLPTGRLAEDLIGLRHFQQTIDATVLTAPDVPAVDGAIAMAQLEAEGSAELTPQTADRPETSMFIATSGSGAGFHVVRRDADEAALRVGLAETASAMVFSLSSITGGLGVITRIGRGLHTMEPAQFLARPRAFLELVAEHRCERIVVPPLAIAPFAYAVSEAPDIDLGSVAALVIGSDLITPGGLAPLLDHVVDRCDPSVGISVGYGMTEIGFIAGQLYQPEDIADMAHDRPVLLGPAAKGRTIRVVDDSGQVLRWGQVGSVEVDIATRCFIEYAGNPEATNAVFTDDGWFRTGDLGFVEDYKLSLVGRRRIGEGSLVERVANLETTIGMLPGAVPGLAWIAPMTADESGDLAAYFCAEPELTATAHRDLQNTVEALLVREHDLVSSSRAIARHGLALTRTGKVHRPSLYERPAMPAPGSPTRPASILLDLTVAWNRSLGRELTAHADRSELFADAGGSSAGLLSLIAATEASYSTRLDLAAVFEKPCLDTLLSAVLAARNAPAPRHDPQALAQQAIVAVRSLVGTWRGHAVGSNALLRDANTSGGHAPLLWVFNWDVEFDLLAAEIGVDYPLYATRSLAALPGHTYTPETVAALSGAIADDVVEAGLADRLVVGGNCQGGILALEVARTLADRGYAPPPLLLLDWNYDRGDYGGAVTLINGSDSEVAQDSSADSGFANPTVTTVTGEHGHYFVNEGLRQLTAIVTAASNAVERSH